MSRSVSAMNGRISQIMANIPYGLARSEAARILVAEIEEAGPPECLAYSLYALTDALAVAGEPDRSLVSFAKLSRLWDDSPELFDSIDRVQSLRTYNLVIHALRSYPSIPLEQITGALDELEARANLIGIGRRIWAIEKFMFADYLGDPDKDVLFAAWQREPRDDSSYPEAIEDWITSHHLLEMGRIEDGLRVARKALTGRTSIGDRSNLLARLQHVYLAQGLVEEARATHIASVQHMSAGPGRAFMARARASNIAFLARSHNVERSLASLHAEQDLLSTRSESPNLRWSCYVSLGAAMTMLIELGHEDTALSLVTSEAKTVGELNLFLRTEVDVLTEQFDRRNGTAEFARQSDRAWSSKVSPYEVDLAIRTTPSSRAPASLRPGDSVPAHPVSSDDTDSAGIDPSPPERPDPPEASIAMPALVSRPIAELRDHMTRTRALLATDPSNAADRFVSIGEDFESKGLLMDAAAAFIAAAAAAERAADPAGAVAGYRYGLSLLEAGGALPLERCGPARSLARAFVNWGKSAEALTTLQEMSEALTRKGQGPPTSSTESDEIARELTEILDTRARVLATAGRSREAIDLAVEAATAFAERSRVADAAFSFLMAGRVSRDDGIDEEETIWLLESAIEGFQLARDRGHQTEATADLVSFLHAIGRIEAAESLAAQLTALARPDNALNVNRIENVDE